jgi:hypothetical protein
MDINLQVADEMQKMQMIGRRRNEKQGKKSA